MNKSLRPAVIVSVVAIFATLALTAFLSTENSGNVTNKEEDAYDKKLTIGEITLDVELADTPEKMAKGLSGRKELPDGKGMLFVYPSARTVSFWMPDMHFPIDIVFIREGKVAHIEHSVPNPPINTPKTQLKTYVSPEPVDMVLEVPAGWAGKNGVSVGIAVTLQY
jgi:uncharacterized protein